MTVGAGVLFLFVLAIVLPVVFGLLTAKVASDKGHSSGLWFVIGFFSGVIGLIVAAVMPDRVGREGVEPSHDGL